MDASNLRSLMIETLQDIYDAEIQILRNGRKMINAASSRELQRLFLEHLKQTECHIQRLEKVFDQLRERPGGRTCWAMVGIMRETDEIIHRDSPPQTQDTGLITGQQKVEHYEIANYGTAVTFARLIGDQQIADLLERSLGEEEETDRRLAALAERGARDPRSGPDLS